MFLYDKINNEKYSVKKPQTPVPRQGVKVCVIFRKYIFIIHSTDSE